MRQLISWRRYPKDTPPRSSPDGLTLAVAVNHSRVFFYDPATLRQRFMIDLRKEQKDTSAPHAIAYHPDMPAVRGGARGGDLPVQFGCIR
ncbi:MAG: hypothetical protein EXR98_05580 [Gemmataceae bacterium]|nr:hypothetical protein [Gemmataceae bacterium]